MTPQPLIAAWLLLGAASLGAAPDDARLLAEFRARGEFEAADRYCAERLAEANLDDRRRAELTIERARVWVACAQNSEPDQQAGNWKKARGIIDDFIRRHPRHPRLFWVRFEGAAVDRARGEAARESAVTTAENGQTLVDARNVLRGVIAELGRLDEELTALVQRTAPNRVESTPGIPARPAVAELTALRARVRYERAGALREQALCYPAGSADRINALSRAGELLVELAEQDFDVDLQWSSRLDEIMCLRLLEDFPAAERKLALVEKTKHSPAVESRLAAERIRLALARGRIDEALSEVGGVRRREPADSAPLEAYLSGWRRAVQQHKSQDAARWEQAALDELRAIEEARGPLSTRKAERLLAQAVAGDPEAAGAAALARMAGSIYRDGRLDEALAMYDRTAVRARAQGEATQAFDAALAAATIEKQRAKDRAAIDRYRDLALSATAQSRAAEVHLLAVHAAGQLGARRRPPDTNEYERLLREHVATWPAAPTTSQAWSWLGRLKEHQHALGDAIAALRHVRVDDAEYALAVESLGRCYEARLAELRRQGAPRARLAGEAIDYFEGVLAPLRQSSRPWNAAARAAALAAARISLGEIPDGAVRAEQFARQALDGASDGAPEWKTAVRIVLMQSLAERGRTAEAERILAELPLASTAEAVAVIDALAERRRGALGDARRGLALLELKIVDNLLAREDSHNPDTASRSERLDAATHGGIIRRRADALAEMGRRSEAISALETWVASNPRDGQAEEDLAALFSAGGDAENLRQASARWREVARKSRPGSPRWYRAHLGLARTQLALGDPQQARATLRLVAQTHPDFGDLEIKAKFQDLLAECDRRAAGNSARAK